MKNKNKQLVCQHLEKIARSAFEKHQDIIRDFIRNRHGIYSLYKNDKLVYVGLATDLRTRLYTHRFDRHAKDWNRFSVYLILDNNHLKELETLTLKIVSPKNNRQSGKFIKSEDLKRKFKRRIKEKHKRELSETFSFQNIFKEKTIRKKNIKGRKPVLSKYVNNNMKIRIRKNEKNFFGRVNKDGYIILNGEKFTSPSLAATHILNYNVDGWNVWQYQRSPGEWVTINSLRI